MKTQIHTAPAGILKNYITRLYGDSSMAHGYLMAMEYAKTCHYDVPPYAPVFGVIAARVQATNDVHAFRTFVNAHADELRAEQECDRKWQAMRKWAEGPSAAEVVAKNQAAVAADQLEQAINARAEQIARERELAARAKAFSDARRELGGR